MAFTERSFMGPVVKLSQSGVAVSGVERREEAAIDGGLAVLGRKVSVDRSSRATNESWSCAAIDDGESKTVGCRV